MFWNFLLLVFILVSALISGLALMSGPTIRTRAGAPTEPSGPIG